jgi:hypothetical protein
MTRQLRALCEIIDRVATKPGLRQEVYFAEAELTGLIKIGLTTNLDKRLACLERATGSRMTLLVAFPGDWQLEKLCHMTFWRVRGLGEWFRKRGQLAVFLSECCEPITPEERAPLQ